MSTAMRIEVDGEEISPDQLTRAEGWKTAGEKLKQRSHASQDGAEAAVDVSNRRGDDIYGTTDKSLRHRMKRVNKGKLLKGARMPDLPREDVKIVMRPRGGLQVSDVARVEISRAITGAAQVDGIAAREDIICPNHQQNIIVVSTSKREHADKYAMVKRMDIRGTAHEVSTYESAPHGTVKGVIRGIPLEDTAQEIQDLVLHKHNPTALQAKRIGKTRSVVIAFEGPKVPNYVRYGNLLFESSLHRKQIDVCYQSGRVGHRMDVCPNPPNRICRGCGFANPDKEHACVPKCGLCGGKHRTADRACKAKFMTPYVVRRRRWERRRAIDDSSQEDRGPAGRAQRSTSSRSRSRTPARKGSHQSRQRSRSRSRDGPNRADQAPSAGSKDGCRCETMGKGGSRSSSGRRRGSRSRSRTRSRTRVESNQRGILAEKKCPKKDQVTFFEQYLYVTVVVSLFRTTLRGQSTKRSYSTGFFDEAQSLQYRIIIVQNEGRHAPSWRITYSCTCAYVLVSAV
ncbi:uncharacterized protein LOC142578560 [Dermacentor variabilis]|uniref:uncharacterized protein LOC142578560 n=1 Tax=Dermacentor variabilis TaxID=34621 RepID=UPI003F5BC032